MSRRWGRWALWTGVGFAASGFTVIALLHTPLGRPLLAKMGVGCPVKASPEAVESARKASARASRGSAPSPARPALGFALDSMGREDVDAWASLHHLDCSESRRGTLVQCKGVPAEAVGQRGPTIDDLSFGFAPDTLRLVNVTTLRSRLDPASAADAMNFIARGLAHDLGSGRVVGEPSAAYLAAGTLHTAVLEYRFLDYIADVSATNLGTRVVLREHYMSAAD